MKSRISVPWLVLLVFLCLHPTSAQKFEPSPQAKHLVSAREQLIPVRARDAFQKGVGSLDKRDAKRSLAHFQRAVAEFPEYYEAYYEMGMIQIALGRNEEAGESFARSIILSQGRYAEPYFGLGLLLDGLGESSAAEAMIRRGLELDVSSWIGRFVLAQVLFHQDRLDEAERNIRETLQRKPRFAMAHALLANICLRKHAYEAALTELEAFLRLAPNGQMSDRGQSTFR